MYFGCTSANGVDGVVGEGEWHRSFVGPETGKITIPSLPCICSLYLEIYGNHILAFLIVSPISQSTLI